MKKKLLLMLLLISSITYAQIPTDDTKRYLLVNGSLQNDANPGVYDLVRTGNAPTTINGHNGEVDSAVQMLGTAFNGGPATATNYANVNQEVTISVWVKIQYASGATRGLFRQTHSSGSALYGYDFYYSGTTLKMYTRHGCYNGTCDYTNWLNSPTSINDNQWHHVVFSVYKEYNATQTRYVQKLYLDGALNASYNFPWVNNPLGLRIWSQNNSLLIGQQPFSNYYEGAMDNIRFYERELTLAEISDLANEAALDVEDFKSKNTIVIYPNPTSNILNIEMSNGFEKVEIYNLLGVKIVESNNQSIDVSNFKSGVYVMKITNERGNSITKRFVKK